MPDKEFPRALEPRIRSLVRSFRTVFLTGPRQVGKTTLARRSFPRYRYVSLEDIDEREFARADPRGFLARFDRESGVILDEAQRAPDLFSYLQGVVDGPGRTRFVLTGSQQFHLAARVSQTLAGRAAVLQLQGLSIAEVSGRRASKPGGLVRPAGPTTAPDSLDAWMFRGSFPRLHAARVPVRDWLNGYVRTYVERDVRELVGVADAGAFGRFLALVAGRTGQVLNATSLGADAGVSHTTVNRWLSVLQASGLVFLAPPHRANFRKRIVKAPKLFLTDTGLACFLLGIRSPEDLRTHPLRGAIFETLVATEIMKVFINAGEPPQLAFFRDRTGHEIDFIVEVGRRVVAIEAKSAVTVREDSLVGLRRYRALAPGAALCLISGAAESANRSGVQLRPWHAIS